MSGHLEHPRARAAARAVTVLSVLAAMIAGGCSRPETAPETRAAGLTLPAGAAVAAEAITADDLLRDVTEL